jgi:hypothetical protein
MSTLSCPFCGHPLTDSTAACTACGKTPARSAAAPQARPVAPAPRSRLVPWLIGLPVGAFAVLMVVGSLLSTPESSNQWVAREAIKVCNKEVARAPEDRKRPDLTAQDCADLDAAFRSQYGTAP